MSIVLSADIEVALEARIATGRYASPEAVVEEALKALDERDQANERARRLVSQRVDRGLSQLDAGHSVDGDEFFERLLSREPD